MKIARCIFLSSEHKGTPSGTKKYDYFVPSHLDTQLPVLRIGSTSETKLDFPLHAAVLGGEGFYTVVRIVEVVELDKRQHHATKPLISLVDDRAYLAGKARQMRAREIVEELANMEHRHRQMERIRAMGAISPEAEKLVQELDGIRAQSPLVVDFTDAL